METLKGWRPGGTALAKNWYEKDEEVSPIRKRLNSLAAPTMSRNKTERVLRSMFDNGLPEEDELEPIDQIDEEAGHVTDRLYKDAESVAVRRSRREVMKLAQEKVECTFQPKIEKPIDKQAIVSSRVKGMANLTKKISKRSFTSKRVKAEDSKMINIRTEGDGAENNGPVVEQADEAPIDKPGVSRF